MSSKNNIQEVNGALSSTYTSSLKIGTITNNVINVNELGSVVGNVLALNSVASNMYGVAVKWFRSIPQERSKDVLFMEWTLYNVEDCPLNLNVIYNDSGYDEAALTYNMMGIEYSIPLTMSISILDWQRVTNHDGSTPAKGDIIYIPQSNRLYEVVSMTPQKTVASQITSYKVNLQKYQPKRNRFLGDNLSDTIDIYTNSVEKLLGEEIEDEIKDIINDKQLSPHNSTSNKDKYKELLKKNATIIKDIICDGHTIAKSYYKNTSLNDYLVYYKNISDVICKNDTRTFSCIYSFENNINKENKLKNISLLKKNNSYHIYKCVLPYTYNCGVSLESELIQMYGEYNYKNKELKISNKFIEEYGDDWFNFGIKTYNNKNNLITSDNFSIDIIGNTTYILSIKGKDYIFNSDFELEKNKWYNFVFNLGKNTTLKIYNVTNKLKLLHESQLPTKKWGDFTNNEYYIKGGDNNITNIRLYNIGLDSEEKYITNAITYLGNDDSKLIINDNADVFFENDYYGNPR